MKKRFKTFAPGAGVTARVAPVAILTAAVVLAAGGGPTNDTQQDPHSGHDNNSAPAMLVQVVRNSTGQFVNVNNATAANYQPMFGCVTGPDQGAMGIHYINLNLYGDGGNR